MNEKSNPLSLSLFKTLSSTVPEPVTWERIVETIRSGSLKPCCDEYRRLAGLCRGKSGEEEKRIRSAMSGIKRSVPAFVASVEVCGGRSGECVRGYTGYVMVDIDHIPAERFAAAERAVKSDSHAFLAYITLSGCGLRVIARASCAVTADNFRLVWNAVNGYFADVAGVAPDRQCSNATRMSCLSHDPCARYNPDAVPVEVTLKPANRSKGRPPKVDSAAKAARRLTEQENISYTAGSRNKYVSSCIYWMNRFGIPAEQTLAWALDEFSDYNADNGSPVASIVGSIYRHHADEHGTRRLSGQGVHTGGKPAVKDIETWINGRYRLRKNSITQYVEVQDIVSAGDFCEINDVLENTIWREMQHGGLNVDMATLRILLQSSFVPAYHPLRHYLDNLAPWDGKTDHIGAFLAMVHCRGVDPEVFDLYVRRWLVAMIAAVLGDGVVNHEILVLLGRQGTYKSSFMNNILPPCLRRYYCVKTNSQRMTKDDVLALTENILINMEEIDSMTRQEVNQLKAMVSMPYVNERPPYGRNKVRLPHIASFCATGNNLQFLTDDTGNRRWLVFEVDHIDNPWTAGINYDGIYAQLKYLLDSGFKYWFDGDDIAAVNAVNRRFETPNMARELISTHYRKPGLCEPRLYLSSSQIVARFAPQVKLSPMSVGKSMSDLGFAQVCNRNGRFWEVVEVPVCDIGRNVPGCDDATDDTPF